MCNVCCNDCQYSCTGACIIYSDDTCRRDREKEETSKHNFTGTNALNSEVKKKTNREKVMTYYLVVDAGITKKPECCSECPLITSDEDCVDWWCVVTQEICKNINKRNRYCPIKGFVKKANVIKEVVSQEEK